VSRWKQAFENRDLEASYESQEPEDTSHNLSLSPGKLLKSDEHEVMPEGILRTSKTQDKNSPDKPKKRIMFADDTVGGSESDTTFTTDGDLSLQSSLTSFDNSLDWHVRKMAVGEVVVLETRLLTEHSGEPDNSTREIEVNATADTEILTDVTDETLHSPELVTSFESPDQGHESPDQGHESPDPDHESPDPDHESPDPDHEFQESGEDGTTTHSVDIYQQECATEISHNTSLELPQENQAIDKNNTEIDENPSLEGSLHSECVDVNEPCLNGECEEGKEQSEVTGDVSEDDSDVSDDTEDAGSDDEFSQGIVRHFVRKTMRRRSSKYVINEVDTDTDSDNELLQSLSIQPEIVKLEDHPQDVELTDYVMIEKQAVTQESIGNCPQEKTEASVCASVQSTHKDPHIADTFFLGKLVRTQVTFVDLTFLLMSLTINNVRNYYSF